jgi:heme-degrading monooxygenase HmoA
MHTRVLTFTGARDIDAGLAFLREQVAPIMGKQHGYRGLSASADRPGSVLGVLSLWETAEHREASERALVDLRSKGAEIIGAQPTVELFEQLVTEVKSPAPVGSALMVTRVSMDPSAVDENLAYFRSEPLTMIAQRPGFLGLRYLMDRETGRGIVGSTWQDRAALDAWAADSPKRREEATKRGVRFEEQSLREIVFAHLP